MLFGFVTSGLPFSGDSLKRGALGGSETAVISVTSCLAKRGHNVKVFCRCNNPGTFDGVEYRDVEEFATHAATRPFDVLIASRWPNFLAIPSMAGLRVLWNHDVVGDKDAFMPYLWQTDLLMCLSDYHVENWCEKVPELRPHIWKTSNGIDFDLIKANIRKKVPGKLIFTSRPERGLLPLLRDIMPRLWKVKPELRLHFCSYDLGKAMELPASVQRIHDECKMLAASYGNRVLDMGGLTKENLYRQISSSQLGLYPSSFPEISFLGAMENQACGTPMIGTDGFATAETLGYGGIKIPGLPEDPEYIEKFVDTTLRVLDDADLYQQLAEGGPRWIEEKGYTWDRVAASWERKFSETLDTRFRQNKTAVLREMVRTNDLQPALLVAQSQGMDDFISVVTQKAQEILEEEMSPEEVVPEYKRSLPRFDRIFQIMVGGGKFASVLDLGSGPVSFGLIASKAFPDAPVTVIARDAQTASWLVQQADTSKLHVTVLSPEEAAQSSLGKFDVVYVGNQMEMEDNPQRFLAEIQAKYLADGGRIAFATHVGTSKQRWAAKAERVWNFDSEDFSHLLGESQYSIAFVDDRKTATEDPRGYWCGVCTPGTKFGKIDIQGKAHRTRPYRTIGVCMITRNEEDSISAAIKSILPVADEIHIADSNSTDRTVEFAKELGAEVRLIDFDNFSQARNASKEGVDTDWIFWFDADERVVGADELRRYSQSTIYRGFACRQNHLMLDIHGTYDLPVRMFRNIPEYQFTGMIHEHAEDTSVKPFDAEIRPSMVLPDVDLAHYGYLNEAQRRQKCSYRNMHLLQRDIEECASKGRMLTWVLVIRDYLNVTKWSLPRTRGKIEANSREHHLLSAAVLTYLKHFAGDRTKYAPLAEPMYQEALMLLGRNHLPCLGFDTTPFQVEVVLAGGLGGLNLEGKEVKAKRQWFVSSEEFDHFSKNRTASLLTRLGVAKESDYNGELKPFIPNCPDPPDAMQLLDYGVCAT